MIPVASSVAVVAPWAQRTNQRAAPLVDFEVGGSALDIVPLITDTLWKSGSDGSRVWVGKDGEEQTYDLFVGTAISSVSIAFDQSMHTHVAYVEGAVSKFRYWDSITLAYDTLLLPDARTPRCTTDEKTEAFSGDRDLILMYMRGTSLYARVQRERFQIEHLVETGYTPASQLTHLAMNTGRRLQWRVTR